MDNYFHLVEFDDVSALEQANEALAKNWSLIHVGTKSDNRPNDLGQEIYINSYVFGLTKEQYDLYQKELEKSEEQFNNLLKGYSPSDDD